MTAYSAVYGKPFPNISIKHKNYEEKNGFFFIKNASETPVSSTRMKDVFGKEGKASIRC
jgi:hypothetical protein